MPVCYTDGYFITSVFLICSFISVVTVQDVLFVAVVIIIELYQLKSKIFCILTVYTGPQSAVSA